MLRLARRDPTASPGKGTLRSVRYRFNFDDLDRTLEEIAGKPFPAYDDFWVRERVRARRAYLLLDEILSVRARGLTNLHLGLEVGLRELERATTTEQTAVLFSDGLHNLGEDPLPLAGKYRTLHVIGTTLEDAPVAACQELAAAGHGRSVFVRDPQDIPAAVSRCLSG